MKCGCITIILSIFVKTNNFAVDQVASCILSHREKRLVEGQRLVQAAEVLVVDELVDRSIVGVPNKGVPQIKAPRGCYLNPLRKSQGGAFIGGGAVI